MNGEYIRIILCEKGAVLCCLNNVAWILSLTCIDGIVCIRVSEDWSVREWALSFHYFGDVVDCWMIIPSVMRGHWIYPWSYPNYVRFISMISNLTVLGQPEILRYKFALCVTSPSLLRMGICTPSVSDLYVKNECIPLVITCIGVLPRHRYPLKFRYLKFISVKRGMIRFNLPVYSLVNQCQLIWVAEHKPSTRLCPIIALLKFFRYSLILFQAIQLLWSWSKLGETIHDVGEVERFV